MANNNSNDNKSYLTVAIVAIIAILVLVMFVYERDKTPGERIGSAIDEFSEGVKEAGEELDPNRTFGEEVADEIEDAGDRIQDAAE